MSVMQNIPTLSHSSYSNRALRHSFQHAILRERSQDLLRIGRASVTIRWFVWFRYTGSYSPATQGTTSARQDQLKDGIGRTIRRSYFLCLSVSARSLGRKTIKQCFHNSNSMYTCLLHATDQNV